VTRAGQACAKIATSQFDANRLNSGLLLTFASDLGACTEDTALAVGRAETFAGPVTCFMDGQANLANTAMGRDLGEGEVVKVICVRSRIAYASHEMVSSRAPGDYPALIPMRRSQA
jgi:hypothetical protein